MFTVSYSSTAVVRQDFLDVICLHVFKQVKRAAAGTEKAWQGAGEKPGLQIWRIVNFKVQRGTSTFDKRFMVFKRALFVEVLETSGL